MKVNSMLKILIVSIIVIVIASFSVPNKSIIKWKFKTKGAIGVKPLVHDGLVYFGNADGIFYALDIKSGVVEWKVGTGDGILYSNPQIYKGLVFFGTAGNGIGNMYGLDLKKGKDCWGFAIYRAIFFSFVIDKGMIYFPSNYGNYFYAVDLKTSFLKWTFRAPTFLGPSPIISDGVAVFGGLRKNLYGLDVRTGKKLWVFPTKGWDLHTPLIRNGVVYFGRSAKNFYAIDLKTGKKLWKFVTKRMVYSRPATDGKFVYFGSRDEGFHAVNLKTGKEKWRFKAGAGISSFTLIGGELIYFSDNNGILHALDLKSGKMEWKFPKSTSQLRELTLHKGLLYFGGKKNFYAIDAKTGVKKWEMPVDGMIVGITVSEDVIYFGTREGTFYAIDTALIKLLDQKRK